MANGGCSLFHAVSTQCETTNTLILIEIKNYLSVSLFHDLPGRAIANFNPRFRWFPVQFKLPRRFPQNREAAKQRPILTAPSKGYLFHTALKQLETARTPTRTCVS
jgi:hypothetical protein